MTLVRHTIHSDEITVTYEGYKILNDLGVPRSSFWDVVDVKVVEVYILDVFVDVDRLPDNLLQQLLDWSDELTVDDWS